MTGRVRHGLTALLRRPVDAEPAVPRRTGVVSYRERLRTPWWWYLAALAVAVLLGAEFAFAVSGWITWVPLLILIPACLLVVWRLSSAELHVIPGYLTFPEDELELDSVVRAVPLTATELRRVVGRHGDPRAKLFIRSWIGPGVQFVLKADDQDVDEWAEIPYWVVSTRHPDALVAAISQQT